VVESLLGEKRQEVSLKHGFEEKVDLAVLVMAHLGKKCFDEFNLLLFVPRLKMLQADVFVFIELR
jgi:hypothetical protein